MRQTRKCASSAQLVMPNRLGNKRRALNAAPGNSTTWPVRFIVNRVSIQRTLVAKEEPAVALSVQLVGRPQKAVRNVIRAMLAPLAKPKVFVQHARLDFIKILKDKRSAVIPVTCYKKYPTKNVPGVNCRRGGPATWANI